MSGDGLVPPLNAPAGQPMLPGVQPGAPGIIIATLVIINGGTKGGVFVYDPSAGPGNLIASMTDAAADPYSNVAEKGVSAYVVDVDSLRQAVNLNENSVSGNAGMGIQDTAHPAASPPGAYGQGSGTGGLSRAVAFLDSGLVTNADVDAVVSAQSQAHSAVTNGLVQALAGEVDLGATPTVIVSDNAGTATWHQALLAAPASPGNGFSVYANALSMPNAITTGGTHGMIPVTLATQGGNTVNSTGFNAAFTPYPVPGGDTQNGSVCEISCGGHGTQATGSAQPLNFRVAAFGQTWGSSTDTGGVAAGADFHWNFTGKIILGGATNNAPASFYGRMVISQAVASAAGHATAMDTQVASGVDTTSATNITLQVGWAATTGSPTIVCTGSEYKRYGA